ncbi:hypothetical protein CAUPRSCDRAFT_11931, partial [Caulochytrium protostelioides]
AIAIAIARPSVSADAATDTDTDAGMDIRPHAARSDSDRLCGAAAHGSVADGDRPGRRPPPRHQDAKAQRPPVRRHRRSLPGVLCRRVGLRRARAASPRPRRARPLSRGARAHRHAAGTGQACLDSGVRLRRRTGIRIRTTGRPGGGRRGRSDCGAGAACPCAASPPGQRDPCESRGSDGERTGRPRAGSHAGGLAAEHAMGRSARWKLTDIEPGVPGSRRPVDHAGNPVGQPRGAVVHTWDCVGRGGVGRRAVGHRAVSGILNSFLLVMGHDALDVLHMAGGLHGRVMRNTADLLFGRAH